MRSIRHCHYGLTNSGAGVTVRTNVTHSSWTLGFLSGPPFKPAGGLTFQSPAGTPEQRNYEASDAVALGPAGLDPTQIHELAHALDNFVFGGFSDPLAEPSLVKCVFGRD
jgi:hypothetical protein